MRRLCLALAMAALLLLVAGVGTATANPPAIQDSGQLAGSDQGAGAAAGTAQQEPTNDNGSVRVLSPGDEGDVTQTNTASSDATATNLNATNQTADQTQSGGAGLQAIGQSAESDQDAFALALTVQEGATNENRPVRVLSPGDGGEVTQTNEASSDATAGNANLTGQSADQTQAGGSCKCGSDGEQLIGQSADSDQEAGALAVTEQEKPTNTNISVRVLSEGDDGPVTQTNTASSDASAGNLNVTKQDATQDQTGGSCKCGTGGDQVIGQSADSDQKAGALATTVQEKPKNTNISVRVLSPGDDGPVTQTNEATSNANAGNVNGTQQTADQTQAGGSGLQTVGQSSKSEQDAQAAALTAQKGATNENVSVRVLSPGRGGSVTQSNTATSNATAANLNGTKQDATQDQTGGSCKCGSGTQLIGQYADNDQKAGALAVTIQEKPSNTNTPIRVLSKGDDGDVTQSNTASSDATALNLNGTHQSADQDQAGGSCKCGSGTQLIGQYADNDQKAGALAVTIQEKPSNTNTPIRVLSKGDDGDVTQSNTASSNATAANLNLTKQTADQAQDGSGLQVIGQAAKNEQDAFALGLTFQLGASNENAPVRVLSPGDGGSVSQANTATSNAVTENVNWVDQNATQTQGGPNHTMGCCGTGIQAIGQLAKNRQGAVALSATFQLGNRQPCVCREKGSIGNSNEPNRVLSPGDDGAVRQANTATSTAAAMNWNAAKQTAVEIQAAPCVCREPGIQAIGQLDDSNQFAASFAASLQLDPKNASAPDREKSPGRTDGLTQVGKEAASDGSGSRSLTDQSKRKVQRW